MLSCVVSYYQPPNSEEFSDEEFSDDDQSDSDMTQSEADAEPRPQPPRNDVEQAARQAAMDKLVPGLDPAEYGKMPPSFHNNSQRVAPITMETELREVFTAVSPGTSGEPQKRPIRPPIIPRDKYDGVDSDDESDEENEGGGDDDEEADKPQIVGDVEIDMDEEEDEFLEFARQVLGMSDDQWSDIVRERKGRGGKPSSYVDDSMHLTLTPIPSICSDAYCFREQERTSSCTIVSVKYL